MTVMKSLWTAGLGLLVTLAAAVGVWASTIAWHAPEQPAPSPALTADSRLPVLVEEEKKVAQVRGTLAAVDAATNTVTIETPGIKKGEVNVPGQKLTFAVAADAKISQDGKPVKLGDLKTGQPATVRLTDDKKTVTALAVGVAEKAPAEKGVAVTAKVKSVDLEAMTITLIVLRKEKGNDTPVETDRPFTVALGAKIVIDGKPGELKDVKAGVVATVKVGEDKNTAVGILVGEPEKKPEKKPEGSARE